LVFQTSRLSPADAAVMETFVVPRYLAFFGELAMELLLAGEGTRIVHLNCRTGYPDRQLFELASGASIVGVDASQAALDLARNKAATLGDVPIRYRLANDLPTDLEDGAFSHALTLHPLGTPNERIDLYREMCRLLCLNGQALIALPLRGSYQEVGDLFREYALKHDDGDFGKNVEESMAARHTIETLSEEIETAGLDDVDVEIRTTNLAFDSGRAFMEDPVTRLLILPDLRISLGDMDLEKPLAYVRDAIDKYWSEGKFELTLNVGCASARRVE
jgi:ubiquinone/menaquinone biosynthesis C-methylase UbiE